MISHEHGLSVYHRQNIPITRHSIQLADPRSRLSMAVCHQPCHHISQAVLKRKQWMLLSLIGKHSSPRCVLASFKLRNMLVTTMTHTIESWSLPLVIGSVFRCYIDQHSLWRRIPKKSWLLGMMDPSRSLNILVRLPTVDNSIPAPTKAWLYPATPRARARIKRVSWHLAHPCSVARHADLRCYLGTSWRVPSFTPILPA